MKNWVKLIICLLIPLIIGAVSGFVTMVSFASLLNASIYSLN